ARPQFRLRPILFALIFSYPLSGCLFEFEEQVRFMFEFPRADGPAWLFVGVLWDIGLALSTLAYLGFPVVDDGEHHVNLYPLIIPVALVLLVLATRAVRLGPKPPQRPDLPNPETSVNAQSGPLSE